MLGFNAVDWILLPTRAGRALAELSSRLLPEIEARTTVCDRAQAAPDLLRLVFPERRRAPGRAPLSLLCRPLSYDHGVLTEVWDDVAYGDPRALRAGDTVVDVGAHGGFFTTLAAARVGARGRVIAVEPAPENLALLRENIRRNRLRNVRVVPVAAARRAGISRLYWSPGLTGHSLVTRRTPRARDVRTATLDTITRRHAPRGAIALVKIDAEAAELDILRGSLETLPRVRRIVAACYHTPREAADVSRFLRTQGFRTTIRRGMVRGHRS